MRRLNERLQELQAILPQEKWPQNERTNVNTLIRAKDYAESLVKELDKLEKQEMQLAENANIGPNLS